jgi:hypothetical protein
MNQDKKIKLKSALRDNLLRRKADNKSGLHRPKKETNSNETKLN